MSFVTLAKYKYSQTSVHERLGSWTIRFTNKFSEHKASRMTTVSRVTNTQAVNIVEG